MVHRPSIAWLALALCWCLMAWSCDAFGNHAAFWASQRFESPSSSRSALKMSSAPKLSIQQQRRRGTLLNREGPYFELQRFSGKVEFGSTANLVTRLPNANPETISSWLSNERRVMSSIWDKDLIKEKGNSVFELKVMTLQFVTIQLAPSVDLKAWVENENDILLQSVAFDPNIQILPGVGVSAKELGIEIEVVGELGPTNGGVTGRIAFQSSGILPPPMRLLPEPALRAASDAICQTITKFAIQSFQNGAVANYREFAQKQEQQIAVGQESSK